MPFCSNGATFIEDDDQIVGWCRQTGKDFEPKTADWIFSVMARGGCVIDVGASTGWYSIPLAMRGCDVHSIEPHPGVRQRLYDNMALNNAFLRIYPAAASSHEGGAVLAFNSGLPLTSGASIEPGGCIYPTSRVRVPTITIDALCLTPTLIKIDVEAHEIPVLEGATDTITEHRPHLVAEANTPRQRERLLHWLAPYEYHIVDADERNLLCTPNG